MNQTSEVAEEMNPTSKAAEEMNPTSSDMGTTDDLNIMRQEVKNNIPTIPNDRLQMSQNLPRADLLVGSRENYIRIGVPLYEASIKGDWEAAEVILYNRTELLRFGITENYETALHVAASAEDSNLMKHFVQNLVNKMDKKDLELQNMNFNTALSLAAAAGSVKMAQIMVDKNKDLLEIPGSQGMMPLYFAALFGKHDMVEFLYNNSRKMTGDNWTDQNRGWVVQRCVEADIFDVAQKIVTDCPELTTKLNLLRDVLQILARKPDAFKRREGNIVWRTINSIFPLIRQKLGPAEKDGDALQLLKLIWAKMKIMPKNEIDEIIRGPASSPQKYSSRVLFVAAKTGNTRFIVELIRAYPDLIWKKNDRGLSIFHIAVKHRHQGIYNLLYEIGSMKDLITPLKDEYGNNMLHLVGKTSRKIRSEMSGESLLMQRELLWFKEVEKMMPPTYRERMNKNGVAPYALFSKENRDLVTQGLNWMKDCMVVATLIVTVAFAVAFTVPGGYKQDKGIPIFIHESAFLVFVIADRDAQKARASGPGLLQ